MSPSTRRSAGGRPTAKLAGRVTSHARQLVVLDVVVVGAGQAGVGVTIIWRGPAWLGWK